MLLNFVADIINTPFLTTFMLGAIIIIDPMVIIPASSDWIILIPTCCVRVSTTIVFYTIGGAMLTQDQQCYSLQLPIGIHYGAVCEYEYPFGSLFLVWIVGQMCRFCGPN